MLGVVGADHQLTAGVEFARRRERDGQRKRRAGAQRRRERVADEPELGAALAGAATVVVVVAEVAPIPLRVFAPARFAMFRLARPARGVAVVVAVVVIVMVVVVMVVVMVVVLPAAFVPAARCVIAAAAPTAATA